MASKQVGMLTAAYKANLGSILATAFFKFRCNGRVELSRTSSVLSSALHLLLDKDLISGQELTLQVVFHIRGNKKSRDPIPDRES